MYQPSNKFCQAPHKNCAPDDLLVDLCVQYNWRNSYGLALAVYTHGQPMVQPDVRAAGEAKRWLVVVARGQTELYAHLVQAFATDDKVRVIVDRRQDDTRNSPQVAHRLRTHGVVIIHQT